jgi:uncharacterized protein
MFVIIPVVVVILAVLLGASYLLRQAITPRTFPYLKSYAIEVEQGKLVESEYLTWEKEELRLRSPFGYELSGTYFPLPGSQKTIIIVHGFTYTRMGAVKYMPIFRQRGYNVLIYDQRYHGLSGGANTTFGYYEKHDLKAMMDWAVQSLDNQGIVGTMGESLGAATCLQHAALDPRVAFVVADCGYADLYDQLVTRLRLDYHLPPFPLLPLASWMCRRWAGFSFRDVSPERDVALLEIPVMIIHGIQDDYIFAEHAQRLYAAKRKGLRKLYLVPDAGHAEAYWNNRAEYDRLVGEFLREANTLVE